MDRANSSGVLNIKIKERIARMVACTRQRKRCQKERAVTAARPKCDLSLGRFEMRMNGMTPRDPQSVWASCDRLCAP